VIVNYQL